jgi:hypothetical protein
MKKICSNIDCREEQPVSEFRAHPKTRDGLQPRCSTCQHLGGLRTKGVLLTPDVIQRIRRDGRGQCEICGRHAWQVVVGRKRLDVDHDHATGRFRGLLCGACNTALGKFDHAEAWLANGIRYLRRFNDD